MRNKINIIVTSVLILILLGLLISFVNAFWGNPISAAIATGKIKSYVKENYPDMDLEIPKASYNFKFSNYFSTVQSKTSPDTYFTVEWSDGKIYDTYESDVINHFTTLQRISTEFNKKVEAIINEEFPYETSILIADFGKSEVDLSKLTADMVLDITNPPIPASLIVYVLSNDISYEYLSARLLDLYQIMEKHQIPIDLYSVVIEEPLPEGEKSAPGGESLHLFEFPAEKIMAEDLIAEIKMQQEAYEVGHKK